MFDSFAMQTYALAATFVTLHLFVLASITAIVRTRHKEYVNPEDATLSKGKSVEGEHADVARVKRAHQNLLENAVPFLAIGLLYAMCTTNKQGPVAYFGAFVGARVLHTVFYLWGKQPFRTISFAIGVAAILGMAFHVVRAAL